MVETKDQNARMELNRTREQHLIKQSLERRKYYKHVHKARQHPDKYMSMIIDGMDQSKTEIPHFLYMSSLTSGMWKLKTHLVGALVHGVGLYGFFDWYQYAHSSNLTIHVILNILLMTKDSLPDVLYLQMDNCARENKNRFVFGFLSLLVELKVLKKIKVSFLMVGHTHEDIDQFFSRILSIQSVTIPNPTLLNLSLEMMENQNSCTRNGQMIKRTGRHLGVESKE
ncbi:uncharacterized protein [Mytilus edulis]|uniref:uncharacterized protein isoform X2 n=1 Tax=Mytilus edulis TaxID=6550 RepID=UPI0039F0070F